MAYAFVAGPLYFRVPGPVRHVCDLQGGYAVLQHQPGRHRADAEASRLHIRPGTGGLSGDHLAGLRCEIQERKEGHTALCNQAEEAGAAVQLLSRIRSGLYGNKLTQGRIGLGYDTDNQRYIKENIREVRRFHQAGAEVSAGAADPDDDPVADGLQPPAGQVLKLILLLQVKMERLKHIRLMY